MISTIIGAIVTGAIIGALARLVMPGRQGIGMVMTILLGIVGSFLGSWITLQFGYHNGNGGFAFLPYIVGVVVAAVLIAVYVAIAGGRNTTVRH
ncbi:MAG: GlsB/YeaQ/YmgE family stress response membrane protein [Mycobacterium sp.]|jgi:uncharacterized membrane protein YeaQ/YmgE (transglycosylase-associated protein family)